MMTRTEFLYLAPYLISLLISLGVFTYTWRHRQVRGAGTYLWFVGGQTLTIAGFIFELATPTLEIKIFWDMFQWITDTIVLLTFLAFAIEFTERKFKYSIGVWSLILILPSVLLGLLLTDSIHHLIYPNPHLSQSFPFQELEYDLTTFVYIYAIFLAYLIPLYGIGLLVLSATKSKGIYRAQFLVVAAGFMVPVVAPIFALLGIKISPLRDIGPIAFAIGNLIVSLGLFRYSLFDIAPIAREKIVEDMVDPVIVLDINNRVVDVNQAVLKKIDTTFSEIAGSPARIAFTKWPAIKDHLENIGEATRPMIIKSGESTFYELSISPLENKRGIPLGHIIVVHDISRHKILEDGYKQLSEQLEERVRQRTEELRKSAEQYRAVVENQTEFIVRHKPDGTRTFVNEAYCRYWGITLEQALATHFIAHVDEEGRPAIEERFSRLRTGNVSAQTGIYRVITPDGDIGWQEWNDQAIRDESGNIVEFQSVGRDVTERKQAEEALRKSEAIYREAIEVSGAVPYRQSYPGEEFHIKYDFIGEGIRHITGYGAEEFNEALWDSLVKESHLLGELTKYSWREAVQRVRTGASPIWQCEHRIQARNGETRWVYEAAVELRDRDGKSHGSIGLYQDITERKQAEQTILNQLAFDELMTRLLTRLSSSSGKEIDTAIENGLKEIAEFTGADYADVIILSKEEAKWSTLHRWLDPHLVLAVRPIQNIPVGRPAWSENKLLRGEVIRLNTLDDYPPEAIVDRQFSEAEGAKSILSMPIRGLEQLAFGCVDLISHTNPINWSDSDLTHLKIIGDVIANILERKRAEENLAEAYDTTLEGWAKALELRDKETEGHSRRVTETTLIVARAMGFNADALIHIRRGCILHDIGKMGIPDEILRKNGPLTDEERTIVEKHPNTAFELLKGIQYLEKSLEIPYSHHEKWDGTGYPRGLKGEEIPITARIFAVADVWDALSYDRPYRNAWEKDKVIQYLRDESEKYFDPKIVQTFLELLERGEI